MILRSDLPDERLENEITDLIEKPERITEMERAAKKLAKADAAKVTVDLIEKLSGRS